MRKVECLGHVVSAKGVEADPAKISKVQDWPQPRDVSEVRSLMGQCAYYHRFVQLHRVDDHRRRDEHLLLRT